MSDKTKIYFICWGYSVHAQRRIDIFCQDKRFEVKVASPFAYNFENATQLKLVGDHNVRELRGWRNLLKLLRIAFYDLRQLRKDVKKFKPDVIFLHTLMYPCYLAYFLPRRIPLMITFWNGDILWWAKWNGIERLFKRRIVEIGVRRARAITVNSQMAYDKCLDYGTTRDRIHLIRYPGIDLTNFYARSNVEARKKIGISQKNVILWPRGLGGYLNSDILLKAAIEVVRDYPDTLFLFLSRVGLDELSSYQAKIDQLGLTQNFRFESQVEHAMMPWYLSASNVMVSISSNDSLPNVMLEALACEVPVIVGDIPQLKEWIVDKENGLLVSPRDAQALAEAIKRMLNPKNQPEIKKYIKKGLEKVKSEANGAVTVPLVKNLVVQIVSKNKEKNV